MTKMYKDNGRNVHCLGLSMIDIIRYMANMMIALTIEGYPQILFLAILCLHITPSPAVTYKKYCWHLTVKVHSYL